jgi:hypothetical protein
MRQGQALSFHALSFQALPLLHGRADRIELVVQERAARVVHDGYDCERDAGGDQTVLNGGGSAFIGKERPEQSHHRLLFIRQLYVRVVFEVVN